MPAMFDVRVKLSGTLMGKSNPPLHTHAHSLCYTETPPPTPMLASQTLTCQRKTHGLSASGSNVYVMPQERALSSDCFLTHPPAMPNVSLCVHMHETMGGEGVGSRDVGFFGGGVRMVAPIYVSLLEISS